jgi:hypothetical protein
MSTEQDKVVFTLVCYPPEHRHEVAAVIERATSSARLYYGHRKRALSDWALSHQNHG